MDGIVACAVAPCARGALSLDVIPADASGVPTQAQLNQVAELLEGRREIGLDVLVRAPVTVQLDVDVTVRCADGVRFNDADYPIRQAVRSFFTGKLLGKPVYESALSHLIFRTGLVKDCIVDMDGRGELVGQTQLPVLQSLTVSEAV